MLMKIIAVLTALISIVYSPTPVVKVNPNPIKNISSAADIRVMTYNLKVSGVGKYSPSERVQLLADNIHAFSPDSVGFEEASQSILEMITPLLEDYAYVGLGRDKNNTGEASPVFYLKSKYDLIDSGTFWLSKTPEKVSKGWDALLYNRVCSYAILKDKETGFVYAHFNAHFDHLGIISRQESASLVCRRIAELCPDIPVVFSGDLNDEEGSAMYNLILSSGLRDSKMEAKSSMNLGTYHGYSTITEKNRTKPIDFIFVNNYCSSVENYTVDTSLYNGIYPSDHHPVIVDATFFNG